MRSALYPVLLVCCTCSVCPGQSTFAPVMALSKQVIIKRVTARAFVNPSVGIQHGRNLFLAGPVIAVAQFDNVQPDRIFLTGFQCTHRYLFTKTDGKRLRFFGEFMGKYQELEEEWVSNYWSKAQSRYIDYEAESEETIWDYSLGAGLMWNFHRNFSLDCSFGFGYYISHLRYDDLDELPNSFPKKDYRGYNSHNIFYNFQIGITLYGDR